MLAVIHFGEADIEAMSLALDSICAALKLERNSQGREQVALLIIELAQRGERSFIGLRDRVLSDLDKGNRVLSNPPFGVSSGPAADPLCGNARRL